MISCRRSVSKCLLPQMVFRLSSKLGHAQPCCSSQNGPMILSNSIIADAHISTSFLRMFSSSADDISHERPQMYQLEHIQKRLEFTVPLMFKTRLDYTFYSKNVYVDNQILGSQINGLENLINHIATINIFAHLFYTHVETRILNILPILEDGTVRLRWRICYLGWVGMLNLRNFNPEYRQKNLKWYDGYSIFYVDGEGLVYKATIQKTMPDDSLKIASMKDKTKEFVQRKVLPNPTPNCVDHQQQFASAKFTFATSQRVPSKQRENNVRKERQNETKTDTKQKEEADLKVHL